MADVKKLLEVLHALVEAGNSMVIIEHNLDVIKSADWLIDMGPEGGQKGGSVMAVGTPESVARVADSYTGQFLKKML
jgi:excinuclease ABC subunit A